MTSKSRVIWIASLVALVATFAIGAAAAQDRALNSGRRGAGPGRGGPGGFLGLPLQRLDLTDAQREQIRALVQEHRTDESAMKKVADLQRELRNAVFADTPDVAQVEQLKTAIAEAQAAALNERIDLELRMAQILTPEQRQKAREARPGRGRP